MKIIIAFNLMCILFFFNVAFCLAWEADFHYGAVKWLAFQAGFSLDDAERIAAGSESLDENPVLKASSVILVQEVCISGNVEASRHVQNLHFPSDGFVPSLPTARRVVPGNPAHLNAANLLVRQQIETNWTTGSKETRLDRLGVALHPLADSWSHQGAPGIRDFCLHDNLIWSHPLDRDSFFATHNADLTHKFPKDAMAAAEAIYYYLRLFLEKQTGFGSPSKRKWTDLKKTMKIFVDAETKAEKLQWFKGQTDVPWNSYNTYPCFLLNINLVWFFQGECANRSDGNKAPPKEFTSAEESGQTQSAATISLERVLNDWIVNSDLSSIVTEKTDLQSLRFALLPTVETINWTQTQTEYWAKTLFGLWLIKDHGQVNLLGHGDPNNKSFKLLAKQVISREGLMKFERFEEAIHAPGTGSPYILIPLPSEINGISRVAAVFKFRHIPRDTIILKMKQDDERFIVDTLTWISD